LTVAQLHPGVTREQVQKATGWEIRFSQKVQESVPPAENELRILRDLLHRTAVAHGQAPAA
jgi:glutaconate CoA-transferase subunit B